MTSSKRRKRKAHAPAPAPATTRSHKPLWIGGGAAAALLVGVGGFLLVGQGSTPAVATARACAPASPGMVWVPAGEVTLGSNDFEPEEAPVRRERVSGFWMDRTEVTNDQFAAFVRATGYRTVAERPPVLPEGVDVPPEMRQPGGIVFRKPAGVTGMVDINQWWSWVPGAHWRQPEGPGSSIAGRGNHPVLQIAYEDAQAYARWKGHQLPSEAQWEYAARGGVDGRGYIWGDEAHPGGRYMANSWQGAFPVSDGGDDGFKGTAPVGCYDPNPYGLYDMAGNVWEWSNEGYGSRTQVIGRVGDEPVSIRGGSWLCAPNFCGRFRPSARQPGDPLTGTTHIGFRTIRLAPGPQARNTAVTSRTQLRMDDAAPTS